MPSLSITASLSSWDDFSTSLPGVPGGPQGSVTTAMSSTKVNFQVVTDAFSDDLPRPNPASAAGTAFLFLYDPTDPQTAQDLETRLLEATRATPKNQHTLHYWVAWVKESTPTEHFSTQTLPGSSAAGGAGQGSMRVTVMRPNALDEPPKPEAVREVQAHEFVRKFNLPKAGILCTRIERNLEGVETARGGLAMEAFFTEVCIMLDSRCIQYEKAVTDAMPVPDGFRTTAPSKGLRPSCGRCSCVVL